MAGQVPPQPPTHPVLQPDWPCLDSLAQSVPSELTLGDLDFRHHPPNNPIFMVINVNISEKDSPTEPFIWPHGWVLSFE